MRKCLLLLLFSITLFACKDDKDAEPDAEPSELITGFKLIDQSGNMVGEVGTPNEKEFADASLTIRIYPNPFAQYLSVSMETTKPSKISVWFTHATLSPALKSSPFYVSSSGDPGKIALMVSKDSDIPVSQGSLHFYLDLASLAEGPYRMYFKVGKEVSWKNIIIKR